MEIRFHGRHNAETAGSDLLAVIRLLKESYHIKSFREMHLTVTLVDGEGYDVELIDSETKEVYQAFEVFHQKDELNTLNKRPMLKLVIDNS